VEGWVVSGAEIALMFVSRLRSVFLEALPVVIGFLVLVAAVTLIVRFLLARGYSARWESDHSAELDAYDRGERDSVG
jgi:hypothetical protein